MRLRELLITAHFAQRIQEYNGNGLIRLWDIGWHALLWFRTVAVMGYF